MMAQLFDEYAAGAVVNSRLGLAKIDPAPPLVKRQRVMSFIIGQPLGYLSSWLLFALSHHLVIWLAAERTRNAHRPPLI